MSKQGKDLLIIGIICGVGFMMIMTVGLICMTKNINQRRYENPPEIDVVEQDIKEYMLNYWYKSNVSLTYVRQEKINDTCIVYYFKLDNNLFLDGHNTYYIKAIYKYRNNDVTYKDWFFEKVLRSNYSEALDTNNNE